MDDVVTKVIGELLVKSTLLEMYLERKVVTLEFFSIIRGIFQGDSFGP